jgi:hypothetical protein
MPAMDVSSVDCSVAPARMMSVTTPQAGAMDSVKSESVDRAYADIMKMMVMHAAMLSKIEMKCAKNAQGLAAAKKMQDELDEDYQAFELLQQEETSQGG